MAVVADARWSHVANQSSKVAAVVAMRLLLLLKIAGAKSPAIAGVKTPAAAALAVVVCCRSCSRVVAAAAAPMSADQLAPSPLPIAVAKLRLPIAVVVAMQHQLPIVVASQSLTTVVANPLVILAKSDAVC